MAVIYHSFITMCSIYDLTTSVHCTIHIHTLQALPYIAATAVVVTSKILYTLGLYRCLLEAFQKF